MKQANREKLAALIAFALIALVALNGCTTNFEPNPLPPDHPASVQGEEAPRSGMKRLVSADQLTRASKAQLSRQEAPNQDFQSGAKSHDMGNMPGMDMSNPAAGAPPTPPQAMPGMDASQMQSMTPAAQAPLGSKEAGKPATIYTCVMHPEVQQPGPGKCPKCGMTLVKKEPASR